MSNQHNPGQCQNFRVDLTLNGLCLACAEALVKERDELKRQNAATGIEAAVCRDVAARQEKGLKKYGTTVADNPLTLKEWLQHAYEEGLDEAIYLRRAIAEIESSPTAGSDFVTREEHERVIDAMRDAQEEIAVNKCAANAASELLKDILAPYSPKNLTQVIADYEASKTQAEGLELAIRDLQTMACDFIGPDEDGNPECTCCGMCLVSVSRGHRMDCLANAILQIKPAAKLSDLRAQLAAATQRADKAEGELAVARSQRDDFERLWLAAKQQISESRTLHAGLQVEQPAKTPAFLVRAETELKGPLGKSTDAEHMPPCTDASLNEGGAQSPGKPKCDPVKHPVGVGLPLQEQLAAALAEIERMQRFHVKDMRVTNESASFHMKECAQLRADKEKAEAACAEKDVVLIECKSSTEDYIKQCHPCDTTVMALRKLLIKIDHALSYPKKQRRQSEPKNRI